MRNKGAYGQDLCFRIRWTAGRTQEHSTFELYPPSNSHLDHNVSEAGSILSLDERDRETHVLW